ncbi:MAG: DnaJ domain-containing protein [Thermodesulfobacteriota bacterium]
MMKTLKDYYHILGVEKSAPAEEIKKAYRQLAVKFHPDHNPGDKSAEERFKLISEAYAVLTDPAKRTQYDQAWAEGAEDQPRPGFTYTQEEIFREFFAGAQSRQAFRDLAREFKESGFTFDDKFFNRVFFGGQGFFFGGVFFSFSGPKGGTVHRDDRPDYRTNISSRGRRSGLETDKPDQAGIEADGGLLAKIGRGVKNLTREVLRLPGMVPGRGPGDLTFNLTVAPEQASRGTDIKLEYSRDGRPQRLTVKVPPGTRDGARLRLKNMGRNLAGGRRGDLFLHVRIKP